MENIESYSIRNNRDYAFKFCSDDDENKVNTDSFNGDQSKKLCLNCKMPKSRCLDGKPLLMTTHSFVGRKVKACSCGNFWTSTLLNQKATIMEENTSNKVTVNWDQTNVEETHYRITNGTHNFEFDCSDSQPGKEIARKNIKRISDDEPLKASASYFIHRLPFRKTEKEHWEHATSGEKHRIKFSTSENILLTGLGFLVAKTIDRVNITVLYQIEGRSDHSVLLSEPPFFNVESSNSSVVLKLKKPLPLNCDRIYLLVVTLFGGASIVGHGGEEFISVVRCGDKADILFKFESYKEERTDVEKGVIEKIYFEL